MSRIPAVQPPSKLQPLLNQVNALIVRIQAVFDYAIGYFTTILVCQLAARRLPGAEKVMWLADKLTGGSLINGGFNEIRYRNGEERLCALGAVFHETRFTENGKTHPIRWFYIDPSTFRTKLTAMGCILEDGAISPGAGCDWRKVCKLLAPFGLVLERTEVHTIDATKVALKQLQDLGYQVESHAEITLPAGDRYDEYRKEIQLILKTHGFQKQPDGTFHGDLLKIPREQQEEMKHIGAQIGGSFVASRQRLVSPLFKKEAATRPGIDLHCHSPGRGSAMNVKQMAPILLSGEKTVVEFDPAGWALSDPDLQQPTEGLIMLSAKAVMEATKEKIIRPRQMTWDEVTISGYCFGCSMAAYLFSEYPETKLVLMHPYRSMASLLERVAVVGWMLKRGLSRLRDPKISSVPQDGFNTVQRVKEAIGKGADPKQILLFVSKEDAYIPKEWMFDYYEEVRVPRENISYWDGPHELMPIVVNLEHFRAYLEKTRAAQREASPLAESGATSSHTTTDP
jgi:hypothetical protein